MMNYVKYRDDLETIAPDEAETHQKIIDVMATGMKLEREKYGRTVRISHAKAHGLLKGTLTVYDGLAPEFAQGMFAKPGTYDVLVRMAQAPGEFVDDSKVQTDRGMSVKVLGVQGPMLDGNTQPVQDWVFDVGKQFLAGGAKEFLQAFKPNAEIAPKLSDNVKGVASTLAKATNAALHAVGANSEKLAFYGHEPRHPMSECYFSQTPYRYGDYVAKLGFFPVTPGMEALVGKAIEPQGPDGLRDELVQFFRKEPAEFELRVQLNVDTKAMPIENAQGKWSEDLSEYWPVAKLVLPKQDAWDPEKDGYFEDLSFSPGHALVAHRPLGSINRARLAAYRALAAKRLSENGKAENIPTTLEAVPN